MSDAPIHAPEAEENLVGSLLHGVPVPLGVQLHDLTDPRLRLIFSAAVSLPAGTADPTTVAPRLQELDHLEAAGGVARLSELTRLTLNPRNAPAYAEIVRTAAARRRLAELLDEPTGGAEFLERLEHELTRLQPSTANNAGEPLELTPVSAWAQRDPPPPREWVWADFIPAARVTSFLGDGGQGKTTIAIQIGMHAATGRALYGHDMKAGKVLGIFCEDEPAEVERRVRAACDAENVQLADVANFVAISRDGKQNLLCTFDRDSIVLTPFYQQLDSALAVYRPQLLILDVTADFFAGDYLSTPHVRQFIKVGLGAWCSRYELAVLLLAHPSASGLNSGEGDGYSRAWSNTVRSRFFLRRPRTDSPDDAADRRILEVRKSNYGPSGVTVSLVWERGVFVPDASPVGDSSRGKRTRRGNSRLTYAVLSYLREQDKAGVAVVRHGAIMEHLMSSAALPADTNEHGIRELAKYEANRKQLSRALNALRDDGMVQPCSVPKGYRLVHETEEIE